MLSTIITFHCCQPFVVDHYSTVSTIIKHYKPVSASKSSIRCIQTALYQLVMLLGILLTMLLTTNVILYSP